MNLAPEAIPALVYGVPGLKLKGKNLVAVAAHAAHLGIYPCSSKVVSKVAFKHTKGEISKGTIRFVYDKLPTKKEIKEIVLLRAAEIK